MGIDIITGLVLTVLALGVVAGLTLWCRSIIEHIHAEHAGSSLREIEKEIHDG
jgi:hypothetical protein